VVGCPNNCPYCYGRNRVAKRLAHRCKLCGEYKIHPHLERLNQPIGLAKPSTIFINSLSDLAFWETEWKRRLIEVMRKCPQHTFLGLTKFPEKVFAKFPDNFWLGMTIDKKTQASKLGYLKELKGGRAVKNIFVSFEPLLEGLGDINLGYIDWVIIGAETGNRSNKITPKWEWIYHIMILAKAEGIPIFIKNNVKRLINRQHFVQELPILGVTNDENENEEI